MNKTPWQTHIDPIRLAVDERLDAHIARWQGHPLLLEAMAYAGRAGGKRLRPLLAAATCRAFFLSMNSTHPSSSLIRLLPPIFLRRFVTAASSGVR